MGSAQRLIASAFARALRRDGLDPEPSLRLWAWTSGPDVPGSTAGYDAIPTVEDPRDLGGVHEQRLDTGDKRRRGAWFTPAALAERIAEAAIVEPGRVADPACGGGAFLLAAAERLRRLGADPGEIVRDLLWGCDVDADAVAVCEAALWWWSARLGAPTVPGGLVVGDVLDDVAIPPVAAVVGNPPFLGQLRGDTRLDEDGRDRRRARWGDLLGAYTDPAALFLPAALDAVPGSGGRVALIQPLSTLAARDAAAVRTDVERRAVLEDLWFEPSGTFAAAVDVTVLFLRSTAVGDVHAARQVDTEGIVTHRGRIDRARTDWAAALADARGVPDPPRPRQRRRGGSSGVLADVATVLAGFRTEYYDLVPAVVEDADPGDRDADGARSDAPRRLVTAGAVDPFRVKDVPVRFAKHRWSRPVVLAGRAGPAGRRWIERQAAPKVLVATQTPVLEAVADPVGDLVGSVPVLAVVPAARERLWHLLAVLAAPCVSAWCWRAGAGTALSADAVKPTRAMLDEIPLPVDADAWDRAAVLARDISAGSDDLTAFAEAADAAFGIVEPATRTWWLDRLPLR